jgi:hypothetical protein
MASSTIFMKRHDTRPFLDVTLKQSDGTAIDLSLSVSGVTFTMKDSAANTIKVNRGVCSIVSAAAGSVRYSWTSSDTDTAGAYLGEFEIAYSGGDKLTVPTSGTLSIVILEDYDNA